MNTHVLNSLNLTNQQLTERAFDNYRKFLTVLCTVHKGDPDFDTCHGLIRKGDFVGLVAYADVLSSQKYSDAYSHYKQHQLAALIRKYPFPLSAYPADRSEVAFQNFLLSERKCALMNKKFLLLDTLRSPNSQRMQRIRSYISYVLGPFSFRDVTSQCDHGPGVSIGVHGNETSLPRKMLSEEWSVTPSAFYYARAAIKADPLYVEYLLRRDQGLGYSSPFSYDHDSFNRGFEDRVAYSKHNKIAFVAKTAKTDRIIAVEPLLNGYLQLGTGRFIASRLKRVGIDLSRQSVNQELALLGSLDGPESYVTVDLSRASDSISIGLCRHLLPPDWFDYLNAIRSKEYLHKGSKTPYAKFVSMGNGFCFPLESLLFAAMCSAACAESGVAPHFSVYGDDLVVRKPAVAALFEILKDCGFTPNPDKTFSEGPFRESCGADWYSGVDVRPVTLAKTLGSVQAIFSVANEITRRGRKPFFGASWDFLVSLVPLHLRFVRPYPGPSSTALQVSLDEFMASPFARWNRKIHAWGWKELLDSGVADKAASRHTHYDYALLQGALRGCSSHKPFTIRRETTTSVTMVSHGGASSNWVPGTSFTRGNLHDLCF